MTKWDKQRMLGSHVALASNVSWAYADAYTRIVIDRLYDAVRDCRVFSHGEVYLYSLPMEFHNAREVG